MRTLDYGRKLPEDTDPGELWFPAFEYNIQRDDEHDHDGDNSPRLTSVTSSLPSTQDILSADWVSLGGGTGLYYQDVVLPIINTIQLQFDDLSMEFRLTSKIGRASCRERVYVLV